LYTALEGQSASATASTAIGKGMANTNKMYDLFTTSGGRATSTYAAGIAWAFANNGKTDWHLGSLSEMTQLCKWQRGQAWTSDATACANTGTLNSATYGANAMNFVIGISYWSSSEKSGRIDQASQLFMGGNFINDTNKDSGGPIRIVRAFG